MFAFTFCFLALRHRKISAQFENQAFFQGMAEAVPIVCFRSLVPCLKFTLRNVAAKTGNQRTLASF